MKKRAGMINITTGANITVKDCHTDGFPVLNVTDSRDISGSNLSSTNSPYTASFERTENSRTERVTHTAPKTGPRKYFAGHRFEDPKTEEPAMDRVKNDNTSQETAGVISRDDQRMKISDVISVGSTAGVISERGQDGEITKIVHLASGSDISPDLLAAFISALRETGSPSPTREQTLTAARKSGVFDAFVSRCGSAMDATLKVLDLFDRVKSYLPPA